MWPPLPSSPGTCGSQTLATWIQRDIGSGLLSPGEKLPPQRAVASRLGIAIGTVTRAYGIARRRGWIVTRVGDGSFVRNEGARALGGRDTIDFSRNDPIRIPAEREALAETMRALARRPGELDEALGESGDRIDERVRRAGAQILGQLGWNGSPHDVVPCASTQHALLVLLGSVMRRGETLLCEPFVFPVVRSLADNLGVTLVPVDVDEQGPLPEAVDAASQRTSARAIYMTPSVNPLTGRTVGAKRRTQLAGVAQKRDLVLIEDVDDGLLLDEHPPTFASLAPERAFLLAETTKSFCTGGRLSMIAAPSAYVPELENGVRSTIWSIPALPAMIAAEWIEDGTALALMRARRLELQARQAAAAAVLKGFDLTILEGSPHLWIQLPDDFPVRAAIERAESQGTPVTDTERFCMPGVQPPNGLRICLARAPLDGTLEHGLKKLAAMLRRPLTRRADVF